MHNTVASTSPPLLTEKADGGDICSEFSTIGWPVLLKRMYLEDDNNAQV